jgi:hypothetical protein
MDASHHIASVHSMKIQPSNRSSVRADERSGQSRPYLPRKTRACAAFPAYIPSLIKIGDKGGSRSTGSQA